MNLKRGILLFAFSLALNISVMACPNCKDFLATEGARSLAEGYFWSILVMLSLPFLLAGFIAFIVFRAYKNSRRFQSEPFKEVGIEDESSRL